MKNNQIKISEFYAQDVYKQWIKLVRQAKSSITIYSPFLNQTINKLLADVNKEIKIRIITRLDADSLCGNSYQIKALIEVQKKKGAEIFHLENLHAKILIVDDEFVSVGSQNFTSQGRQNKETSVVPQTSFSNSKFLKDIKSWDVELKERSGVYLQDLFEKIKNQCEELHGLKKELSESILEIEEKCTKHPRELVVKEIATLTLYEGNKYLICKQKEHLTNWEKKQKSVELGKNLFYPLLNKDTYQMFFARVNQTRISFVISQKNWDTFGGSKQYDVQIKFPKKNFTNSNVHLIFKSKSGLKFSIKFLFNGNDFLFRSNSDSNNKEKTKLISQFKLDKDKLIELLEPFPFKLPKKQIGDFIKKYKYEAKIKAKKGIDFFILKSI